jgi:hypothetical protein
MPQKSIVYIEYIFDYFTLQLYIIENEVSFL